MTPTTRETDRRRNELMGEMETETPSDLAPAWSWPEYLIVALFVLPVLTGCVLWVRS